LSFEEKNGPLWRRDGRPPPRRRNLPFKEKKGPLSAVEKKRQSSAIEKKWPAAAGEKSPS
jgi:hypothetical protein